MLSVFMTMLDNNKRNKEIKKLIDLIATHPNEEARAVYESCLSTLLKLKYKDYKALGFKDVESIEFLESKITLSKCECGFPIRPVGRMYKEMLGFEKRLVNWHNIKCSQCGKVNSVIG